MTYHERLRQKSAQKYAIIRSVGIGTPKDPIFLKESENVFEFSEYFPPLPSSVSTIDYYMGGGYVFANIDLTHSVNPKDDSNFENYPLQDGLTLKEVEKEAEKQDVEAQVFMANCYYIGNVVPKNYSNAVKWFRKAADKGNPYAEYMLGNCYYYGNGVLMNRKQAVTWYRKAADQEFAKAENDLGICYESGYGVNKDYDEARNWYRKAISHGYEKAQDYLANLKSDSYRNNSNKVMQKSKDTDIFSIIWNGLKVLGGGVVIILVVLAKGARKVEKALPEIEKNVPKAGYVINKTQENRQSKEYDDSMPASSNNYPVSSSETGSSSNFHHQSNQVW